MTQKNRVKDYFQSMNRAETLDVPSKMAIWEFCIDDNSGVVKATCSLTAPQLSEVNMTDREFLHGLVERYYSNRSKQCEREVCIGCGKPRVLGQRGTAKLRCKKCRKEVAV